MNFAYVAAVAFLGAYGFFQFFYPYHLMRRDQLSMFLFDGDYIRQTYRGTGWLAQFCSDFLEQFFLLPVAGPLVVALLLTGIGYVTYRISRNFLGRWPSLGIAAVFFAWSFLRETGNVYCTRYTIAVLGYLSLVLAALCFKKVWMKPLAAVVLLGAGMWALGLPYNEYYGPLWGHPAVKVDKVIGLDTEVSRENWDRAIRLSKKDLRLTEASYCYNLAHGMSGDLPQVLFKHAQNYANSLLFWSSTERSPFNVGVVGEAWYQLGDMTLAEQSAIISLISTPNHSGSRPVLRLARCNMITGDEGAAQKYLELLSKTLFYGKWARRVLAGSPDEETVRWLETSRAKLASTDIVYVENEFRPILLGLLEADPSNTLARDYLLCYDLLRLNLEGFMEDYVRVGTPEAPVYKEAVLIWLSMHDDMTEGSFAKYKIDRGTFDRMQRFFRNPGGFRNTYWFYYMNAIED